MMGRLEKHIPITSDKKKKSAMVLKKLHKAAFCFVKRTPRKPRWLPQGKFYERNLSYRSLILI